MRTVLQLECGVLVPHDSTTVTVDWYWSKNINECGRYITEEQGRFDIHNSRLYAPQFNADRITKDLTITSPQTDTGYYWCQVNDPSYNRVFISSNKAPVFDTGTMTFCNGGQSISVTTCAIISNINTPSPFTCFISTQTVSPTIYNSMFRSSYSETPVSTSSLLNAMIITITATSSTTSKKSLETIKDLISIQTDHSFYSSSVKMYTTKSLMTSSNSVKHTSDIFPSHESSTTTEHSLQLTVYQSSSCVTYTNCGNSNDNNTIELISGLIVLSIVMFGLGGVLGGLLTVLWNKKRGGKGRAVVIILLFNL